MEIKMLPNSEELRLRFGLRHGQFFAHNTYKNLWWELNGGFFGFGDLTAVEIFNIQDKLEPGEYFQGWNEHHTTQWQQRLGPMIRIERTSIKFAIDIPNRTPVFPDDLEDETVADRMLGGQGDE